VIKSVALTLRGGGARGLAHIAALEAFDEMGVKPTALSGTSIGAVFAAAYAADRAPRELKDGEVIDLGGGKRVRSIDTPHTPHGWDAGVLFEESTQTLMCGDLFRQLGNDAALTDGDVVGPAIAAEDMFKYSALNPAMGTRRSEAWPSLRRARWR
jgi:predicted acylesterase/phospholipase RssA